MNLESMRNLLKRRLSEPSADGEWTDVQLNELLNLALSRLQTVIMEIDPDAFLAFVRKDLTASQKLYEAPPDMFHLMVVEVKNTATGDYGTLEAMKYTDTLIPATGGMPLQAPAIQKFARFGRKYIALYPVPAADVADGLQLTYVQHLTMSADESVPDIPLVLHPAIVMRAQLYALPEIGGSEEIKQVKADLAEIMAEIPKWYQRTIGAPETLDIDLGKQYLDGYCGSRMWPMSNGIDVRG